MKTIFFNEVENTQELARNKFNGESLLVIAKTQSQGRGRKGSEWENADQSLACSLAFVREKDGVGDSLLPLIASYVFTCLHEDREINLKWPNDLIFGEKKVGGVMIEKFEDIYVAGLGVNYYWKTPGILSAGSLFKEEISFDEINKTAELWASKFLNTIQKSEFDLQHYKLKCTTIDKLVEYPDGRGWVKDINEDGSLKVEKEDGRIISIYESMISEVSL